MFIDIRAGIASIFSCLGVAMIILGSWFSLMGRESAVSAQPARGEVLTLLAAHDPNDTLENLLATRWPEQSERGRIFLTNAGSKPDARGNRPAGVSPAVPDSAPAAIARVVDRADEKAAIQAAAAEALLLEQSREASRSATKLNAATIPLPTPRPRAASAKPDPGAQASAREAAKRTATRPQNDQTAQANKPKSLFESLFSR